jgi:hypothetical protein
VFSFAIDLGSITPNNQPDPVVWAVGLVRDPLVNYVIESGFQRRTGFYWSAYQRIDDVVRANVRPMPTLMLTNILYLDFGFFHGFSECQATGPKFR